MTTNIEKSKDLQRDCSQELIKKMEVDIAHAINDRLFKVANSLQGVLDYVQECRRNPGNKITK